MLAMVVSLYCEEHSAEHRGRTIVNFVAVIVVVLAIRTSDFCVPRATFGYYFIFRLTEGDNNSEETESESALNECMRIKGAYSASQYI